jgi:8-oxo-dGTP pyrophosphatase MutT (NUDIX family)
VTPPPTETVESCPTALELPVEPGMDVSAGAIIHDPEGRVLLQLRDNRPDVAFGGYWGLFGGRIEAGETPWQGLLRELEEELSFTPPERPAYFSTIAWNGGGLGALVRTRHYFLVGLGNLNADDFRLGEGAGLIRASASQIPAELNVMPHDHLALSMWWRTAYADTVPSPSPSSR